MKPARTRLVLCAATLISLSVCVWAQVNGPGPAAPRTVETEVSVPSQPNESLKDLENRAVNEARRDLIEKANGVGVRSQTATNNLQLILDLVRVSSEGMILNPEILDSRPVTVLRNLSWKVRMRAQVTPPRAIQKDPNFKAVVTAEPGLLRPGDPLRLTVKTTADAYIHIFNVFADGSVTVLLPNRYHRDKFVRANTELRFPSQAEEDQGIKLKAALLPNQIETAESVVVIATKRDVDLVGTDFQEAILKDFDAHSTGLLDRLSLKLFDLRDSEWVEVVTTYRIVRK